MTVESFAEAVRAIALLEGAVAHDHYWRPDVWAHWFRNGYSPAEAWLEEQHHALRAL